eukprot:2488131-Amphidinium_carterae.1
MRHFTPHDLAVALGPNLRRNKALDMPLSAGVTCRVAIKFHAGHNGITVPHGCSAWLKTTFVFQPAAPAHPPQGLRYQGTMLRDLVTAMITMIITGLVYWAYCSVALPEGYICGLVGRWLQHFLTCAANGPPGSAGEL